MFLHVTVGYSEGAFYSGRQRNGLVTVVMMRLNEEKPQSWMLCVHLQSAEPTLRNLPPQSMLLFVEVGLSPRGKTDQKLKTEVFTLKCFVDFSSSLESVLRH